jgi:hypothetical protein
MTTPSRARRHLALCLPLALLGACAAGDKPKPVAPPVVIQAPGKAYATVSDARDGAAVVLETAQELRVDLSLSAYEVANNMDWSVVDLKPGVLTTLGSRFERNGRDSNPTESDGATVFRLKAQAPGRVTLNFALRRAYSVGAPTRAVSFDVTVK